VIEATQGFLEPRDMRIDVALQTAISQQTPSILLGH
jgi:hypothetical protein